MNPRFALVFSGALSATLLPACAGGTFHLDSSLSNAPALRVSGPLGFNAMYCADPGSNDSTEAARETHKPIKQLGLAYGKSASVRVGDLYGLASAPHVDFASKPLFSKAVLNDYDSYVRYVHDNAQARAVAEALSSPDVSPQPVPVYRLLDGLRRFLRLPSRITETTAFTFFGRRSGRTVAAVCVAANTARLAGYFDGPRFVLVCRIVSSADGLSRRLEVRGTGTWANYEFSGWLASSAGERALFESQNVVIMGMGGIRGFDLKSPGADQLAALSFWQVRGRDGEAEPRAWMVGVSSPGWNDSLLTTLAVSYVFPWPSGCDTGHVRNQGVDKALGSQ